MLINISRTCTTCEILEEQLMELRAQNKELLDRILLLTAPQNAPLTEKINEQPDKKVNPIGGFRTMRQRRHLLEQESARTAQLINEKNREMLKEVPVDNNVSALEKELGIEDDATRNIQ